MTKVEVASMIVILYEYSLIYHAKVVKSDLPCVPSFKQEKGPNVVQARDG